MSVDAARIQPGRVFRGRDESEREVCLVIPTYGADKRFLYVDVYWRALTPRQGCPEYGYTRLAAFCEWATEEIPQEVPADAR